MRSKNLPSGGSGTRTTARSTAKAQTESAAEAHSLLKLRLGQAGIGKPVTAAVRRTTLQTLRDLVLQDYDHNQYDTRRRQEEAFAHLIAFFNADYLADEITTSRLNEYIAWRRQQPKGPQSGRNARRRRTLGAANATVNRELAALRHGFRLAARHEPPLVTHVPHIEQLKEKNRRLGFFEWEQFEAIREHLPDYLKPVMTVAYYTGWRVPSELLTRQPRHVINGKLVLEAYEAKNERPREFPLDVVPELRETIECQIDDTRQLELEIGRVIPLLFHNHGNPIVNYLPAWQKACAAAGLQKRVPHDFRRSAARNLVNAGVDPLITMKLVGWESIEMLKRYQIIDSNMLEEGAAKLAAYIEAQKRRPAKGSRHPGPRRAKSGQSHGTVVVSHQTPASIIP